MPLAKMVAREETPTRLNTRRRPDQGYNDLTALHNRVKGQDEDIAIKMLVQELRRLPTNQQNMDAMQDYLKAKKIDEDLADAAITEYIKLAA